MTWSSPPYLRSDPATIELFEVVCPSCGDDLGSYEAQPPYIRRLRGPYDFNRAVDALTVHAAWHTRHAEPVRGDKNHGVRPTRVGATSGQRA
jgi:hypothetical protein